MFCFPCEQTAKCTGAVGVCGKKADAAQPQELGLMNDDAFACACYLDQMGNKPKKGP